MSRKEFSRATKREALKRAFNKCEVEWTLTGRCNASLSSGVEFDHILACSNGGDNSLDNCQCVCRACHKLKTKTDITRAAKTKRQSDKHTGVVRPKGQIKSRGFKRYESNTKQLREP